MDKIGPICRGVEDCAIVLNAIYGSDGRDETVVDAPFDWNPDLPLSQLTVGFERAAFLGDNKPPANMPADRLKQFEACGS